MAKLKEKIGGLINKIQTQTKVGKLAANFVKEKTGGLLGGGALLGKMYTPADGSASSAPSLKDVIDGQVNKVVDNLKNKVADAYAPDVADAKKSLTKWLIIGAAGLLTAIGIIVAFVTRKKKK